MSSTRSQNIQANCKIIWGDATYDIEVEGEHETEFQALVRKDFGTEYGSPLTITGVCNSRENAWRELDRMLGLWARQVQSGQPMTYEEQLEIFGGPRGRNKPILELFSAEMKRRGLEPNGNPGKRST